MNPQRGLSKLKQGMRQGTTFTRQEFYRNAASLNQGLPAFREKMQGRK